MKDKYPYNTARIPGEISYDHVETGKVRMIAFVDHDPYKSEIRIIVSHERNEVEIALDEHLHIIGVK